MVAAMFIWGSSFVALKLAFQGYDPMVVIFARMLVASICFLPILMRFRKIAFRRSDLKYMLFMGICEPGLYFLFEAKAMQYTTASQAGMITTTLPLIVAAAAAFFLGERVTRQTLLGFAVAIAGACWLSVGADASASAPNPPLGNLLEFMAMVCATGYIITLKRLSAAYPPLLLTGIQAGIGMVFYFPLLFLPATTLPATHPTIPLLAVIYLGTLVTLGAYGLYNFGLSRIPANQASAYVNLIPVFAILLDWLVLGQTFTPSQYLASLLVFAGVYLSQGKKRHRALAAVDCG
jgi:drug/metabolite transporter (DMT)-like permease